MGGKGDNRKMNQMEPMEVTIGKVKRTKRILVYIALAVEALVFAIVVMMTVFQHTVFRMYSGMGVGDVTVVPYLQFLSTVVSAAIYVGFLMLVMKADHVNHRTSSILFAAGKCAAGILMSFLNAGANMVIARTQSMEYLAASNMLSSYISMVCTPLSSVAFAMFCMACGVHLADPWNGYVPMGR